MGAEQLRAHIRRFYDSTAWKKCRAAYRFFHAFCEECKRNKKTRSMVDVDHNPPLSRLPESSSYADVLRFGTDWRRLQSLCKPCHSDKTAREARPRGVRDPRGKKFMNRRHNIPKGLVGFDMEGTGALERKGASA